LLSPVRRNLSIAMPIDAELVLPKSSITDRETRRIVDSFRITVAMSTS
jgi:hypothetical protein